MLESKIQKDIIAYLRKNKIFHIRFQAQTNINGIPDIICCYMGLFIGLELKQENGRATDLQKKKLDAINNAGGIGRVVRSVEEVDKLFKEIKKMSDIKSEFYKTLNNIVGNDRLSNEEIYIINDYLGRLEATIKELQQENKQLKEDIETFKLTITIQQQMIDELIGKIDKAIEYINSLEFLELMNSANKEDYFKAKNKLLEILGDKKK